MAWHAFSGHAGTALARLSSLLVTASRTLRVGAYRDVASAAQSEPGWVAGMTPQACHINVVGIYIDFLDHLRDAASLATDGITDVDASTVNRATSALLEVDVLMGRVGDELSTVSC